MQYREQVMGVEPTSSAWKADVLAVVRHLHVDFPFGNAGDGNRTRTMFPSRDFKSLASACSATPAYIGYETLNSYPFESHFPIRTW